MVIKAKNRPLNDFSRHEIRLCIIPDVLTGVLGVLPWEVVDELFAIISSLRYFRILIESQKVLFAEFKP